MRSDVSPAVETSDAFVLTVGVSMLRIKVSKLHVSSTVWELVVNGAAPIETVPPQGATRLYWSEYARIGETLSVVAVANVKMGSHPPAMVI